MPTAPKGTLASGSSATTTANPLASPWAGISGVVQPKNVAGSALTSGLVSKASVPTQPQTFNRPATTNPYGNYSMYGGGGSLGGNLTPAINTGAGGKAGASTNPLTIPMLGQQGLADIQAQVEAKQQQQALAQQAYLGVQNSFGSAVDQIMAATDAARTQGNALYQNAMSKGDALFAEAKGQATAADTRTAEQSSALASKADQYRKEALGTLTNRSAQAANALRLGMEDNYNQRLSDIDSLSAQGKISDPEGAKNQLKMEHSRQLGTVLSGLDAEYAKLEATVRPQIDQYTLATQQALTALTSQSGANRASAFASLATAQAQNESIAAQEQQSREIQRVQLATVAQQLQANGSTVMAELLMSPQMAPVAVELLPFMREMYDMYAYELQATGVQQGGIQMFTANNPGPFTGTAPGNYNGMTGTNQLAQPQTAKAPAKKAAKAATPNNVNPLYQESATPNPSWTKNIPGAVPAGYFG